MVKAGTKKKRSKQQLEAVRAEEVELKQVSRHRFVIYLECPIGQTCLSSRDVETQTYRVRSQQRQLEAGPAERVGPHVTAHGEREGGYVTGAWQHDSRDS